MTIVTAGADGISGGTRNDFDSDTMDGLRSSALSAYSSTQFTLSDSGFPQLTLTAHGSGLHYSGGHPSSGTITSLTYNLYGDESATWSGFSVSVATAWNAISHNDIATLTNLFFGGDDTFNMQNSVFADTLVGGAGNDTFNFGTYFNPGTTIDGGTGTDTLNLNGGYGQMWLSVTNVEIVHMAAGNDYDIGMQATSTLTIDASALSAAHVARFDSLSGGTGSVLFTGGAGNDIFISGAGNDTFNAGNGSDTFDCSNATGGVSVNLGLTAAQNIGGGLGTDTLNSVENIIGSQYNDTLTGNSGDNFFYAASQDSYFSTRGVDTFNGGDGFDTVSLGIPWDSTTSATGGVTVDMRTGSAHIAGTDTFISIEKVIGTQLDDTFYGNSDDNIFDSGGYGTIDNSDATGGMVFNMTAYTVGGNTLPTTTIISTGGGQGTDTLYNFTKIVGTNYNDTFYFVSPIVPFVDGGGGNDTISFEYATQALGTVSADQLSQVETSSVSRFILADLSTSIENLTGSPLNDIIFGDEGDNVLHGGSGDDTIFGGQGTSTNEGSDTLYGDDGNDTLYSGGAENTNVGNCLFDGGVGNDALIGSRAGTDTATYQDATGGITVSLSISGPQAVGGGLGTDTLASIENLTGSSFDDTLAGSSGNNTLDGGGGNDTVSYSSATAGVNVSLSIVDPQAVGGGQGTDTLISIENLTGSNFADTLRGNSGDNVLSGLNGDDTIDASDGGNDTTLGGLGNDTFNFGAAFTAADTIDGGADAGISENALLLNGDYTGAKAVVFAATTMINVATIGLAAGHSYNLTTNDANVAAGQMLTVDGHALGATDALTFDGSHETDGEFVMLGGAGNDTFFGGAGNDTLNGGGGSDTVSYANAKGSVTVDLSLATPQSVGGSQGSDTLISIENIVGSNFGDTLSGDSNDNTLDGGSGSSDMVSYANATGGVTVSLATSVAQAVGGGQGNDTLISIESLTGSNFNDTLRGNSGVNTIFGQGGDDTIDLSDGGNDVAACGDGNDTVNFGAAFTAADTVYGGTGNDTIVLNGDYSTGLVLGASTLVSVEQINLTAGHIYNLTLNDANISAGQTMTVNGQSLGAADALIFDGSQETNGNLVLKGGAGNDILKGGAGNDTFIGGAGDDTLNGGNGIDTANYSDATAGVNVNLALSTAQAVGGGDGNDTLTSIENLVGSNFDDVLQGNSGNNVFNGGSGNDTVSYASATSSVIVNLSVSVAQAVGGEQGSDTLTSIENVTGSNFNDTLHGNAGNNVLSGLGGNDVLDLSAGGNDTARGGDGDDSINFGAAFTAADIVDGGTGNDTVSLSGDYSVGVVFTAQTMINVEAMQLAAGHSYNLTTDSATVAAGQTLTVRGASLGAADTLVFNGAHETNGNFIIYGGAGSDTITGGAGNDTISSGAGNDTITGGSGADHLIGGLGADTLVYANALQSTGPNYDTVTGFDFTGGDKFDLNVAVSAIDTTIATGALSTASFDTDLATAVDKTQLGKHHAILFTPDSGDLAGDTFLIIDANGTAGYQAGKDYVIQLDHAAHLSGIDVTDFV